MVATQDRVDDPFETYSGLPDDFDGVITGAYFGYDTNYMNGDKLALIAELESDDLEGPEKILFGTGKDWDPDKTPRGTKISRKGIQKFHENSGCGILLTRMKSAGALDAIKATGAIPMEAKMYEGLSFHWEREEFSYDIEEGQAAKKVSRLVPTKFLGAANGKAAKAAAKPKSEKAAKAEEKLAEAPADDTTEAATGDAAELLAALPAKTRGKLMAKAMATADVEAFVDAVKDLELVDLDVLLAIAPAIFAEANEAD